MQLKEIKFDSGNQIPVLGGPITPTYSAYHKQPTNPTHQLFTEIIVTIILCLAPIFFSQEVNQPE